MEIIVVLTILAAVILPMITVSIPLEGLSLLVSGVLMITKILSPIEALTGFSNPVVVIIWAVFIFSIGLIRSDNRILSVVNC